MSYKRIFSGSAGPFSGILRPRVVGLVTLRFFAKRLFSRDFGLGLFSVGFPVARLVARPFFLSASVSRDLWLGLFSIGFCVAWLVVRPLSCRLPCRVTRGSAFFLSASVSRGLWLGLYSVGFRVARLVARVLCHWAVVIAGATAFATAALVALFIAETRPMDLQSHSYPANRPGIATPLNVRRVPEFVPAPHDYLSAINGREAPGPQRWSVRTNQCRVPNASTCRPSDPSL